MKRTVHVQTVLVEGLGSFPVDMLRYDNCVPATERDSTAIANSQFDPDLTSAVRVNLRRFAVEKGARTTDGRWSSFGWKVVSVEAVT